MAFLRIRPIFVGLLLACLLPFAATAEPAGQPPADKPPVEVADQPAMKLGKDGKPDATFLAKHESFLKRGKEGPIGVLFIGDSITQGWSKAKDVWDKNYGAWQPANFGINGDRTQHVLWRFANGELDGIDPKVVVLMIGTNNRGPDAEIIKGVTKVVTEIHTRLPKAKLLLLGIFPRGATPKVALRDGTGTPKNQALAKLDDGKRTRYLDIGAKFLDAEGVIPKEIMPDALHPSVKGYEIWAEAMRPLLTEMMQ